MEWIGRIVQFLQKQAYGGRLATFHDLLAAEKHLANRVRLALDRELFVQRADKLREAIVDADDFLAFDHTG